MDAESSAQSVKIAADVIGDVATVQCREAQVRMPVFYISQPSDVVTGNHLDGLTRILA